MAVQIQKKKMLCLMRILLEQTDEQHSLTAKELCTELEKYGISAERKSIYSDIDTLRDVGMDILQSKGTSAGYYVGARMFSMPELKLLVDAVQSSKFITRKKSDELIRKLEQLASRSEARELQRQVFIHNRVKTENETIYYNVDRIHSAINANVQIQFQYAEWTAEKKLKLKKNGAFYIVSPWALTWDDENYYLIAYDETADLIKHYRVDKMKSMDLLTERRLGRERFEDFDLAAFAKKTFGMYGGEDCDVTLRCHNSLAGVVLDRFGHDVMMIPDGAEYFRVTVRVSVSRQFFGWLTGIGENMQLVQPAETREEYRQYLEQLLEGMKEE